MMRNNCLISQILLISILGSIAFTGFTYVDCMNIYPDEFLDISMAWQHPTLPVFPPSRNTHPLPLWCIEILSFQRANLFITILRC
jgi:hypothetical protein